MRFPISVFYYACIIGILLFLMKFGLQAIENEDRIKLLYKKSKSFSAASPKNWIRYIRIQFKSLS